MSSDPPAPSQWSVYSHLSRNLHPGREKTPESPEDFRKVGKLQQSTLSWVITRTNYGMDDTLTTARLAQKQCLCLCLFHVPQKKTQQEATVTSTRMHLRNPASFMFFVLWLFSSSRPLAARSTDGMVPSCRLPFRQTPRCHRSDLAPTRRKLAQLPHWVPSSTH